MHAQGTNSDTRMTNTLPKYNNALHTVHATVRMYISTILPTHTHPLKELIP